MRVLVTGAAGFIGRQITAALLDAGHGVVAAVRTGRRRTLPAGVEVVACDLARDLRPEQWVPRLRGIDAVVNCAGILRPSGCNSFDAVHHLAPVALFKACAMAGVRRVIQISALGDPAATRFIGSKHAADEALMGMPLEWTVIRPSVVYSTAGSYGGTSLLRAMAALPGVLLLPGGGGQKLQPVAGEDLARIVAACLARDACCRVVLEAVGPEPVTVREYLLAWRRWLRLPAPRWEVRVPRVVVGLVARLGEWFGRGPLGMTMFTMLMQGNVGQARAWKELADRTGVHTRSLDAVLGVRPGFVQDLWHTRLYFLRPLLRLTLAGVWLASGIAGLLMNESVRLEAVAALGLEPTSGTRLALAASVVDMVLGALLLWDRLAVPVAWLMLGSVAVYSLVLGGLAPQLWLDPWGGLVKNAVIFVALLVFLVLAERS